MFSLTYVARTLQGHRRCFLAEAVLSYEMGTGIKEYVDIEVYLSLRLAYVLLCWFCVDSAHVFAQTYCSKQNL